jgi:hypothetical protein
MSQEVGAILQEHTEGSLYSMLGRINPHRVSTDKAEPNGLPTW